MEDLGVPEQSELRGKGADPGLGPEKWTLN